MIRFRFVVGNALEVETDAVVCAEDTMQIMSPHRTIADIAPTEHGFEELIRRAEQAKPLPLGTFVVEDHPEDGSAVLVRAVVHDFARNPTSEPELVSRTLLDVLLWLDAKGFATITLTAIGAGHGGLGFGAWGKLIGELAANLAQRQDLTNLKEIVVAEEDPTRLTQIRLGFASVPGTEQFRAEADHE